MTRYQAKLLRGILPGTRPRAFRGRRAGIFWEVKAVGPLRQEAFQSACQMRRLPKPLVTSLTRKLDIGPIMQDSCGASESLPTYPMVLEAVKRFDWTLGGPPAAVSRRHPERELLTVTGIGSRVDGLWGLYQSTCKDDFDGPNETLLWPRRGGGSLRAR